MVLLLLVTFYESQHLDSSTWAKWKKLMKETYDSGHRAIIECDHPILEDMSILFFDSSIQIDKNQDYQEPYKPTFDLYPSSLSHLFIRE